MNGEFETSIKNIEQEILALKTASTYSSIRSTQFSTSTQVTTGLYRITYDLNQDEVLSIIYSGVADEGSLDIDKWGVIYARTPVGNTQIVEVNNDYYDGSWKTASTTLVILSNCLVKNVERLT